MHVDRRAFALTLSLGLLGIGSFTTADGPGGPEDASQVKEAALPPGRAITLGGPGFVGTAGAGTIGAGEKKVAVSADLAEGAIVVTARRAEGGSASAEAPLLDVVAYRLSEDLGSRMGPSMIECFRAPLELRFDAESGKAVARVGLATSLPGGASVMVEARPAVAMGDAKAIHFLGTSASDNVTFNNTGNLVLREQVFVLSVPLS